MKITTKKEQRAELEDGTVIVVELDGDDNPVRVRAAKPGNGPDAGDTAAFDINVPGEWLERVNAAVDKICDRRNSSGGVCPDHGRFKYDYDRRPSGLAYECPVCKPTPAHKKASPAKSDVPSTEDTDVAF